MTSVRDLARAVGLLACGAVALLGCPNSQPADASASPPECEAITERCHPVDPGFGPIHDCHETAESASSTSASCMAMQAMCFAVCVPPSDAGSDAGAGNDAGAGSDASADGG